MKHVIAIIGAAGRFGSYLATRASLAGHAVACIDTNSPREDAYKAVGCANLVIFAVPIRTLEQCVAEFAPHVQDRATVIDVCTVKMYPCAVMARAFQDRNVTVVGTHPLFGPQSAPVIGPEHKVAVCPVQKSSLDIEEFFRQLGATPVVVTPDEHDKQQCQQMIDHFIGRTCVAAGINRVPLSTKTHELMMNIVEIVDKNSVDLYEDMYSFNPHAPAFLRNFMATATRMASWLRWANKSTQVRVAGLLR
jgi:prephenate dehydrogenase